MYIVTLLCLILLLVCVFLMCIRVTFSYEQLDKKFYDPYKTFPVLSTIHPYYSHISSEVTNLCNQPHEWLQWPEKELYTVEDGWKVYPIFVFGKWSTNCPNVPYITQFLKGVPGLKIAALSRMKPKVKLTPHQGWASHSNNILRCHYGIHVPSGCYISVKEGEIEEKVYQQNDEWLVFDDSKEHYAENMSDVERIVLIIDIERPKNIKKGCSTIADSKEFLEIVNAFK